MLGGITPNFSASESMLIFLAIFNGTRYNTRVSVRRTSSAHL